MPFMSFISSTIHSSSNIENKKKKREKLRMRANDWDFFIYFSCCWRGTSFSYSGFGFFWRGGLNPSRAIVKVKKFPPFNSLIELNVNWTISDIFSLSPSSILTRCKFMIQVSAERISQWTNFPSLLSLLIGKSIECLMKIDLKVVMSAILTSFCL